MPQIPAELGWNQHGRLAEFDATGYWKRPCAVWLRTPDGAHPAQVHAALDDLARRHAALRCTFGRVDGGYRPDYDRVDAWPLEVVNADGLTPDLRAGLSLPFDPFGADLRRAVLVTGRAGSAVGVAVDHSLCDAWSLDMIVADLVGGLSGQAPETTSDVRDFYRAEKLRLDGEEGRDRVRRIAEALSGFGSPYPTPAGLFWDHPRLRRGPTIEVDRVAVPFASGETAVSNSLAAATKFAEALRRRSSDATAFLMPFHRRTDPASRATIGYLVSKFAVRVPPAPRSALPAVLSGLRDGAVPHELMIQLAADARGGRHATPAPHVTFNFIETAKLDFPGWDIEEAPDATQVRHNVGIHVAMTPRGASALWTRGLLDPPLVHALLDETISS